MTLLVSPSSAEPALAMAVSPETTRGWWPPKVLNGTHLGALGDGGWPSPEHMVATLHW